MKASIMKSRVNNWDWVGSPWVDMDSHPSPSPGVATPPRLIPSFAFLVTWLCRSPTSPTSPSPSPPPPPPTPQSAVDVGGWGNCGPIHKQMLPKPRMWALQEGPHQLCCCWTQSHLLRHLMVEKKWKKARGGCGNRVLEVAAEGNKKPVRHLHFDCEWFGLKKEQFFFLPVVDKRGMEIKLLL